MSETLTDQEQPNPAGDPNADPDAAANAAPRRPLSGKYRTPFPPPGPGLPPLRFPEELFPDAQLDDEPAAETEPSPDALTPEEADAVQEESEQDAWDRYNDAELLGKSFRVRRAVQEAGTQTIKGWKTMGAKVRNAFATPGRAWKQHAFNRAEKAYKEKAARHEGATSERVLEIVSKAKTKMETRKQTLDRHKEEMLGRTMAVPENAKVRRQEYINHLKIKKEDALSHKAVRAHLRSEGVGRRESRSMAKEELAKMSMEFRHKLGGAAIIAEATGRKFAEARRLEGKATRLEGKSKGQVGAAERSVSEYNDMMKEAQDSAVRISTELLPNARIHAARIEEALAGVDAESDEYANLSSELASTRADITNLESELRQWRSAKDKAQNQSNNASERLGDLSEQYDTHKVSAASATEKREMWSDTHDTDQAKLHETVQNVLRPQEETQEGNE